MSYFDVYLTEKLCGGSLCSAFFFERAIITKSWPLRFAGGAFFVGIIFTFAQIFKTQIIFIKHHQSVSPNIYVSKVNC